MTSQWLNKLLDRTGIPGVRRRDNGRLEIYDDEKAAAWAAMRSLPKKRKQRRARKSDPYGDFIARGKSPYSKEARATIDVVARNNRNPLLKMSFGNWHNVRGVIIDFEFESIPALASQFNVSKQALYQAINRREEWDPGFRASIPVRAYEHNSNGSKRRKRFAPGLSPISD